MGIKDKVERLQAETWPETIVGIIAGLTLLGIIAGRLFQIL